MSKEMSCPYKTFYRCSTHGWNCGEKCRIYRETHQTKEKPKCCWQCENLISYNPEEDKCKLDGHIFKDRFCLSTMRDKECPLDISEQKGDTE